MTKHTPGPWRMDQYGTVRVAGGERLMANISFPTGNHPLMEEIQANSRLIAAAPDLLDAIERIKDKYDQDDLHGAVKMMQAAFEVAKKARGE